MYEIKSIFDLDFIELENSLKQIDKLKIYKVSDKKFLKVY